VASCLSIAPRFTGKIRQNTLKIIATVLSDSNIAETMSERDVCYLIPLLDDHSHVASLQMITSTFSSLAAADERFGRTLALAGVVPKFLAILNKSGPDGWSQVWSCS
jgi:hypothetical protein